MQKQVTGTDANVQVQISYFTVGDAEFQNGKVRIQTMVYLVPKLVPLTTTRYENEMESLLSNSRNPSWGNDTHTLYINRNNSDCLWMDHIYLGTLAYRKKSKMTCHV